MKLHLTINGRWVDSVLIDAMRRSNRDYMEGMKQRLLEHYRQVLQGLAGQADFYTDPSEESADIAPQVVL